MASARKTDSNAKSEMIRVRVTPEEHEQFFKIAKARGYETISDLIRSILTDIPEDEQNTNK